MVLRFVGIGECIGELFVFSVHAGFTTAATDAPRWSWRRPHNKIPIIGVRTIEAAIQIIPSTKADMRSPEDYMHGRITQNRLQCYGF